MSSLNVERRVVLAGEQTESDPRLHCGWKYFHPDAAMVQPPEDAGSGPDPQMWVSDDNIPYQQQLVNRLAILIKLPCVPVDQSGTVASPEILTALGLTPRMTRSEIDRQAKIEAVENLFRTAGEHPEPL